MFGSVILDVAVGLVLVILFMSLIASTVQETFAGLRKRRPRTLKRGIAELLRDPELVAAFYRHPRIAGLYRGTYEDADRRGELPSYIPADAFASALLDLAARGRAQAALMAGPESPAITVDSVRRNVTSLGDLQVQRLVLTALDAAQGDLARARASIESWFNGAMDRVSGWYKRETQRWLFVTGLALAVVLDVNVITVTHDLYRDPARRDVAVAMAGAVSQQASATTPGTPARDSVLAALARSAIDSVGTLAVPIGWTDAEMQDRLGHAWRSWFGWLLTAIAISFGAPFWFDVLNKVMVIRSTVKPREKSREEGSEDRAGPRVAGAGPAVEAGRSGGGAVSSSAPAPAAPRVVSAADADYRPHEWASGNPTGGVL